MKKISIITFILLVAFLAAGTQEANAGRFNASMDGWGWGGTDDGSTSTGVGWISLNSSNCDFNGDGVINRAAGDPDAPAACPANGTAIADYGVNMPHSGAGAVTGYAFSQNLGYIDFAPHAGCAGKYAGACEPYPADPSCGADPCPNSDVMRNAAGDLSGWARIVDIAKENAAGNSGGLKGWIKMRGHAADGTAYGVHINAGDGRITNGVGTSYAWSDELGYINFAYAKNNCVPTTFSCNLVSNGISCDDPENCNDSIFTDFPVCNGSGADGCSSTINLTEEDCENPAFPGHVICPAPTSENCTNAACVIHSGTWREISPRE